jgi:hypothetical protein
MGRIQEGLSPSLGHDRHRGNSCGSAPGYNFGLAAINLLTSFLPSPKAALGVLAIIRGIGAWSGNTFLQTYTPTAIEGGCLVSEGLQTSRQA